MNTRTNVKLYSEGGRARPSEIAGGIARLTAACRLVAGYCPGQQRETAARVATQTCGSNGVFMLQFNVKSAGTNASEKTL